MSIGQNIFIDFDIIKNSEHEHLKEELDILLTLKNKIYLWSKTIPINEMKVYCKGITYSYEERDMHKKISNLRTKKKSYKEISEETGIPIKRLGFYLTTNPNKIWTLDDWIKDYHHKDSMIYPKVDFVIDPNSRFVNRFKSKGIDGNILERLE